MILTWRVNSRIEQRGGTCHDSFAIAQKDRRVIRYNAYRCDMDVAVISQRISYDCCYLYNTSFSHPNRSNKLGRVGGAA